MEVFVWSLRGRDYHLRLNSSDQLIISFSPCILHLWTPRFWYCLLYGLQQSISCHLQTECLSVKNSYMFFTKITCLIFAVTEEKIMWAFGKFWHINTSKCSSTTPTLKWVAPIFFKLDSLTVTLPVFLSWTADSQVCQIKVKIAN